MPQFVLVYRGDQRPKDGAAHMTKWKAWMGTLGKSMINPGAPFSQVKVLEAQSVKDSAGPSRVSGYTIIEAANIDAAVEMTKACPHLDIGTIEVAEVMDMKMM